MSIAGKDRPGQNALTRWLAGNEIALAIFGGLVAFCTYSAMYAFRKPFTAAGFEDSPGMFGLDFKMAMVISQAIGYTLSKFAGIKIVSEMGKKSRALGILVLVGIAELALLGFGAVPVSYKFIFLFLNGIPLGMVWGLVFSFLEGRKFTEAMGAALCASFIFASGFVKTVGKKLILDYGVSDYWMPFATGAVFMVPLILFVWLLSQMPEPSEEDIKLRTKREPMNGKQRAAFFKTFAPGLVLLIVTYVILTAFRDFRDNFMNEILSAMGYGEQPEIFTKTETPVALVVLVLLAFLMFIKNNRHALLLNHLIIFIGLITAGISTWLYQKGIISPITWIMATGFATYAAYIPFNCLLFERLIAAFKYVSTAGFLIYVADSFGYLGSLGVNVYKGYGQKDLSWIDFFVMGNYTLSIVGGFFVLLALIYFMTKKAAPQADLTMQLDGDGGAISVEPVK
jgi:hypothetical protein